MSLFLFETDVVVKKDKEGVVDQLERLKTDLERQEASLIEVQLAKDVTSAFIIVETEDVQETTQTVEDNHFKVTLSKEVRLVGETLENVKQENDVVNYLVEWNLPEDLTMDQYLNRKKQNSVHYTDVPEVEFART